MLENGDVASKCHLTGAIMADALGVHTKYLSNLHTPTCNVEVEVSVKHTCGVVTPV